MSFHQKLYAAFVVAVALMGAAVLITYRNGMTINSTAVWLVVAAMPFMSVGLPAAIIRHTGIFGLEEEKRRAAGPVEAHQPNPSNGDTPCPPPP